MGGVIQPRSNQTDWPSALSTGHYTVGIGQVPGMPVVLCSPRWLALGVDSWTAWRVGGWGKQGSDIANRASLKGSVIRLILFRKGIDFRLY